ncbi:MAG: hypothetical protein Q9187_001637 [Circinaria calcarea]
MLSTQTKPIVADVARRSTTGAVSKKAVGLLDMPPELRNLIYQMLLTTEYTFKKVSVMTGHEAHYELTPAVLRVNKQIYREARNILYYGNLWIIVRGDEGIIGKPGEIGRYLPKVCRSPGKVVMQPAMCIKLSFLPSWQESKLVNVVMGEESIEYLIDCLWTRKLRRTNQGISNYLRHIHISLSLGRSKMCNRQQLQQRLLKPFFNVHGYGQVTLKGAIDEQFGRQLYRRLITIYPGTNELVYVGRGFLDKGDAMFAQGRFDEAYHNYCHAQKYTVHVPLYPGTVREAQFIRDSVTFTALRRMAKALLAMKLCDRAYVFLRIVFSIPHDQLPYHATPTERAKWHLLCGFVGIGLGNEALFRVVNKPDRPPPAHYGQSMAVQRTISSPGQPFPPPGTHFARNMAAYNFFNAEWLATTRPAPIIEEFHELRKRVKGLGLWEVDEEFDRAWSETFSMANERFQPRESVKEMRT